MNSDAQNYIQLKNNLGKLKLSEMGNHLDEFTDAVQEHQMTFQQALMKMTDLELRAKEARNMEHCVKTANFPFLKTLEDFDFSYQPTLNREEILGFRNMRFLERAENIIFIGSPGVGKTHLSVSIGIEAAKDHRSTYFVNCNDLLMHLKRAKLENRLEERLKLYARYKLLIIDEVGFLPMDNESSKLFFQLISRRYEKHSVIITTNKPLSQWSDVFGDPVIANAILDRLLHHSYIIKIIGKSYRTKDLQKELNTSALKQDTDGS